MEGFSAVEKNRLRNSPSFFRAPFSVELGARACDRGGCEVRNVLLFFRVRRVPIGIMTRVSPFVGTGASWGKKRQIIALMWTARRINEGIQCLEKNFVQAWMDGRADISVSIHNLDEQVVWPM